MRLTRYSRLKFFFYRMMKNNHSMDSCVSDSDSVQTHKLLIFFFVFFLFVSFTSLPLSFFILLDVFVCFFSSFSILSSTQLHMIFLHCLYWLLLTFIRKHHTEEDTILLFIHICKHLHYAHMQSTHVLVCNLKSYTVLYMFYAYVCIRSRLDKT